MRKVFFFIAAWALGMSSMYAEVFNQATKTDDLQDGAFVLLGHAGSSESDPSKVSAGFASTKKYIEAADAEIKDGVATIDGATVMTLKKNGSYWNLYIGDKPVGHKSGEWDLDTKQKSVTDYAISFNADGTVNIVSQTNEDCFFAFNATNPRFKTYKASSKMKAIELYIRDESSVGPIEPTGVELSSEAMEIRMGDDPVTLTATVEPDEAEDKSLVWGSKNEAVATVADGVVTAVSVGVAKIWVRTNTAEKSDTCVVTVLPALDRTEVTYNIVQKADYLPVGAKVFFGTLRDGENGVMARYESGNNIKTAAAEYGESHHTVKTELQYAYRVERSGDAYVFVDQDGYYLRSMGSSKLGKSATLDEYAKWNLGDFDQDDATVDLQNAGNTAKYLYYNYSNDLFNIYDNKGVNPGTNFTRVVLFSSDAPAWEEREKHPAMVASGEALSMVGDALTLDWGKQEPDPYVIDGNAWGDKRMFTVTITDLSDDVEVTLDDLTGTFYCGWAGVGIKHDRTDPAEINVFWEAATEGTYTATLTFHTETAGVEDIVVHLVAEAVPEGGEGGEGSTPELSVSAESVLLNPTLDPDDDNYQTADAVFSFSAKNLAKPLRMKWHRDITKDWFPWGSELVQMYMICDQFDYNFTELGINEEVNLGTDDIETFELYIYCSGIQHAGTYETDLQFTSLKKDSKTEYAINVVVPVTIKVTEKPIPTGVESQESRAESLKMLRDGRIVIVRNGVMYGIDGKRQ